MNALRARDALDHRVIRIDAEQNVRTALRSAPAGTIFAVFDDGQYRGIVTEKDASLFPARIFADVLPGATLPCVAGDDHLNAVFSGMHEARGSVIPVCGQGDEFLGVISETSLFETLLRRERATRTENEHRINHLEHDIREHRVAASVFSDTSKAIVVLSAAGKILSANPAFYRMTGLGFDECIGFKISRLQLPLFSPKQHSLGFFVSMHRAIRREGSWSGQVWCRQADSEFHPHWLHVNCIRNDEGAISHWIAIFSEIDREKQVKRNLQRMAYYDTLTGLPNRQLFLDRIDMTVSDCRKKATSFALLFVDLDRFKDVNDSLGHAFGDQLLQLVAERLKLVVRASDTIARLGGDEFTIIVHDITDDSGAIATAARIVESFQSPFILRERRIFVTASIGIAQFPIDGRDPETLMKNADMAMYRSKEEGRNRICVFHADLNQEVTERLYLENELQTSLEREGSGLSVHWQPIVELRTGERRGYEGLARWQHPRLGFVSPARFIPVAERYGLMRKFGFWLLRAAAKDIRKFREEEANQNLKFGLNFSAQQIYDDNNLLNEVETFLCESGLPAQQCVAEITESTLVRKDGSSEGILGKFKELGLTMAIDDFGTGYSNLAYLKKFSIDFLKVDQSFVRDVVSDHATRQIVGAIIQMAHGLGIATTAEGIETAEQRDLLLELGCDYGQGYFFGKPTRPHFNIS